MLLRLPTSRLIALITLTLFVQTTTGCLSNEYRIPATELQRVAALPPEARGERVRLVQGVGERRGDELRPTAAELAPPPPEPPGYLEGDPNVGPDVQIYLDGSIDVPLRSGRRGGGGGSVPGGWRPPPGSQGGAPGAGGWRGGSGGTSAAGGWRGRPPGTSGSGLRGKPPTSSGGGGGSGLGSISGGGGGGGNDAAAVLVVLAVVVVALAAVGTVFLVFSEGARFDGYAQLHPDQPLYLKTPGGERVVTLATLSASEAASAEEAIVKDDEWPGLLPLDAVPLNRKGLAFKMELGTSAFNLGPYEVNGMASHIQVGVFPTQRFGIMFDTTLSGAGAGAVLSGDVGDVSDEYLVRHSLALELQAFPLALHRFHLGGFVKGGLAITGITGPTGGTQTGPIGGGGLLAEIELLSRLALTFRAGIDAAHLDSGWSRAGVLTAGVSIY